MKSHTELINYLIELRGLKYYLEIGVFNRDHNFNKIKCEVKTCVDPDAKANADYQCESDFFFENIMHDEDCPYKSFQLIFIDGLHHADQVKKDFENALRYLTDDGFIVLHDTHPHSEKITHVPRDNGEWCGDTFKFACTLSEYKAIDFVTFDMDYGCTAVWKKQSVIDSELPKVGNITWDRFVKEKQTLLRLVGIDRLDLIPK